MTLAEGAKSVGHLHIAALEAVPRHCSQPLGLTFGGPALFIDATFIIRLVQNQEDGTQLEITRNVTTPLTLARNDGSARTFGFSPDPGNQRKFFAIPIGLRASRPFIYIGQGDYKIFKADGHSLRSLVIEAKEEIIMRSIPSNIDHAEFMEDLERRGLLSKEAEKEIATDEDFRTRMEYEAERYLELLRTGELTPEWKRWGRKHAIEIAAVSNATVTLV